MELVFMIFYFTVIFDTSKMGVVKGKKSDIKGNKAAIWG